MLHYSLEIYATRSRSHPAGAVLFVYVFYTELPVTDTSK